MKISVVTICYNSRLFIEKTILSVINQSYEDLEYIVVDGGSTDGTLDVIHKYSNRITKWISEKDEGIYNAMNKALDIITGDWVIFMTLVIVSIVMMFYQILILEILRSFMLWCYLW